MVQPPALQTGARIGIVATARKITPQEVEPALRIIRDEGFEPVPGDHLYAEDNQFAGTDEERLSDLQQMLDDPGIDAILVARGGYGTVRLIDQLNLETFRRDPKWVAGFSDVTALHAHLTTIGQVACLHSMMPVNIKQEPTEHSLGSFASLITALRNNPVSYVIPSHPLDRPGNFSGELCGGNLSVLYSINGSPSMPDTRGKVLFLEDLDEYLYHIDRMMMNLDRSGHLHNVNGLIVGSMTEMNDNQVPYGATAEEITLERVKKYAFPVKFGFPAGHQDRNLTIKLGMNCAVEFESGQAVFRQD